MGPIIFEKLMDELNNTPTDGTLLINNNVEEKKERLNNQKSEKKVTPQESEGGGGTKSKDENEYANRRRKLDLQEDELVKEFAHKRQKIVNDKQKVLDESEDHRKQSLDEKMKEEESKLNDEVKRRSSKKTEILELMKKQREEMLQKTNKVNQAGVEAVDAANRISKLEADLMSDLRKYDEEKVNSVREVKKFDEESGELKKKLHKMKDRNYANSFRETEFRAVSMRNLSSVASIYPISSFSSNLIVIDEDDLPRFSSKEQTMTDSKRDPNIRPPPSIPGLPASSHHLTIKGEEKVGKGTMDATDYVEKIRSEKIELCLKMETRRDCFATEKRIFLGEILVGQRKLDLLKSQIAQI